MAAPTFKLNSGHDMPVVGFGLWKVNNDTCADQIYNAIKAGYRCFDGACGTSRTHSTSVEYELTTQTTATKSKPAKASRAQSKTASSNDPTSSLSPNSGTPSTTTIAWDPSARNSSPTGVWTISTCTLCTFPLR